jgi:hypothetical protein
VQDIAKEWCGKLFVSIETYPVEYDLTAIADATLHLGDRSHPLCTPDTRPTKLQALGFVREYRRHAGSTADAWPGDTRGRLVARPSRIRLCGIF